MATNWQTGDRIQNRWEVHEILRGGMGIVYVVYDHKLHEAFAAKSFQDEIFIRDPAIANLFTQEALAWINLDSHQNVTQARVVQTFGGKPYLLLEYVNGGDLGRWIGTPRLTEDWLQILRFAVQFCDGMTHSLSKGIKAHRDIKPQNCLITDDRILKVTDFGLARVMQEGQGGRGGTPEYMAPEQWDNFCEADERTDIYAFGSMLHAMFNGQPPFGQRPQVSTAELELRHKREAPVSLIVMSTNRLAPLIAKQLNSIASICLTKDPAQRFQNFGQLRQQLADCYEDITGETAPQPAIGTELDEEHWYNKAASLGHLGYYDEEIICCDRAIEINPRWASPWSTKAAGLLSLSRHKEALDCCNRALALNARYARAWLNKGAVQLGLNQNEEALVCFDRALDLDSFYDMAWWHKGAALCNLQRYQESLGCIDRALELNVHDEAAWVNRAVVLTRMSQQENAIVNLDKALSINPRSTEALLKKAIVLLELQRYDKVIHCCDYALEINPRLGSAWMSKGLALYAGYRDYGAALSCFEEAQRLGMPKLEDVIGQLQHLQQLLTMPK